MFKALFNIILNLVATLVQLICLPLNTLISGVMPNLADKITSVSTTFTTAFNQMHWALGLIPTPVYTTLLFIIGVEAAKYSVDISARAIARMWGIIQKIKFW